MLLLSLKGSVGIGQLEKEVEAEGLHGQSGQSLARMKPEEGRSGADRGGVRSASTLVVVVGAPLLQ